MTTTILVPATSANLGPGFDSLGLAVSLYLKVKIGTPSEGWQVTHPFGTEVPSDERNLVVQAALKADPNLTPHHLEVVSDIPLTRGLGSSSSAIVAGLLVAKVIGNHDWSQAELLNVATEIEGHPDNVAPAIYGDLTVSTMVNQVVMTTKLFFPAADLVIFVPNYELLTSASRAVLPETMPYREAVQAGSIGNALVASLAQGNLEVAGPLLEADRYHEPYRASLVPELEKLRKFGHDHGVIATYLSGAGPTIMMVTKPNRGQILCNQAQTLGLNGTFKVLEIDRQGARIE